MLAPFLAEVGGQGGLGIRKNSEISSASVLVRSSKFSAYSFPWPFPNPSRGFSRIFPSTPGARLRD
jgi:hypothetical protein